jgi:hypothetical protein
MSFVLRPLQRLFTGSFFSNSDGTTKSDVQAEIEEIEVPVQTKTNAEVIKELRSKAIKAKVPEHEPKGVPVIDNIADEANKAIKKANAINKNDKTNNTRNTRRSLQKDSSKISNDISEKVADACNNIQKNTRANAARKKASVGSELPTAEQTAALDKEESDIKSASDAVIKELKPTAPIASNASEDDKKKNNISVGIKKVIKGNIVVDAQQTSVFLSTDSKDELDFNTGPELDVADKSLLKSQTTLDNDNSELVDEIQKPLFDKFTELTDAHETELYNEFIKEVTSWAGGVVDPSILREKIEVSVKDVLANMVNTEVKSLTTGISVVEEAKGNVESVYVRGIQGKGVFCNGFYVKPTGVIGRPTAHGGTISVGYQMETNHNLMICLCHNDDANDNIYRWKIMTQDHFKGNNGECWAYMECPGEEKGCSIAFTPHASEAKGPFTRDSVPRGIWSYYNGDDGVWVNNCMSLLFDTSVNAGGDGGMNSSIKDATDKKMKVNKIVDSLANNVTKFWLKRLSKYNETSITWKVIFKRVELELAAIRAGNVFHHCGRPQPPFLSVPPEPYPKQPQPTPPPPPPPAQPTPLTPEQLNNCYPSVIIDSYKFMIGPILDIESFLNRTLIYVTCESIYAATIAEDAGAEIANAGIDPGNPSMIPPPKRIYFWVYLSQSEGMFRVLFMINANSPIEKGVDYTQGTLVHLKLQKILNDYYNKYYKKEGRRSDNKIYVRTKINSLERFNYFILNMPYIHDDFFHPTLTALIPRQNDVEMCEYYIIDKNFTPCITRGLPMNRDDYGMNDDDRETYDRAITVANYKELGNGKFTHPLIVCFTTVYLKSRPSDMVLLLDSFYYTDTVWVQGARNCTALYNILSPVLYISMGAHLLFPDYELSRYRREIYGVASARWGDDTFKRWSSLELLISDHPQYNMYLPIKEQRTASKVASEQNSKLLIKELGDLLENESKDELKIDPTYVPIVLKDASPRRTLSAKTASSSSSSSSSSSVKVVGTTTAGRELVKDRVDIDAISPSDLLIADYFALLIDPTKDASEGLPDEWRDNVNLFNGALNNPTYNMTDFLANLKSVATTSWKQEPFKSELSELQQIILKKYYLYGMFDNSYHMCNGFLGREGSSELYYLSNDGDFVKCDTSAILDPSSSELYTFISKFDNNRKLNYKAGSPTLRVSVHTFAQFYAMKFKYFETIIKDTNGDYPEKDMYMIFQVSSTIVYDGNYKILYAIDKQKTPIACLPDLNVGPPSDPPPSDMESMVTLIGTFKRYSAWGAFFASKMMEYLFDTIIQLPLFFSKFYDILQVCDTYCTTAPFFNFCDKSVPYSLLHIDEAFSFSDIIFHHMSKITGTGTPYKELPGNFEVYLKRKLTEHTHLLKLFTNVFMAPFMNLNDPDYATADSGSSDGSGSSMRESDFGSLVASQISEGASQISEGASQISEGMSDVDSPLAAVNEGGGTIVKHNTPIVIRPPILKHKSKSHLRNTMKMLFKPKQPRKSKIIFADTSDNSDDIGGTMNPIGGHPGKYNKLRTTRRL